MARSRLVGAVALLLAAATPIRAQVADSLPRSRAVLERAVTSIREMDGRVTPILACSVAERLGDPALQLLKAREVALVGGAALRGAACRPTPAERVDLRELRQVRLGRDSAVVEFAVHRGHLHWQERLAFGLDGAVMWLAERRQTGMVHASP